MITKKVDSSLVGEGIKTHVWIVFKQSGRLYLWGVGLWFGFGLEFGLGFGWIRVPYSHFLWKKFESWVLYINIYQTTIIAHGLLFQEIIIFLPCVIFLECGLDHKQGLLQMHYLASKDRHDSME